MKLSNIAIVISYLSNYVLNNSLVAAQDGPGCKAWTTGYDVDGMQFCPKFPKRTGPWAIMRNCWAQTTLYTSPTEHETELTMNLSRALVNYNVPNIALYAQQLNARFCKVVTYELGHLTDQYLVGIKVPATSPETINYSGPFYLVRWSTTKLSPTLPVLLELPHVDTDGTRLWDTFVKTRIAFALINGQKRVPAINDTVPCQGDRKKSDAAHNADNLFLKAHIGFSEAMRRKGQKLFVLHVHGFSSTNLYAIITNGIARKLGNDSLIYAFTNSIYQQYPNDTSKFMSCADGTPLPFKQSCGINQAWMQVRYETCSRDIQCRQGGKNRNTIIGLELSSGLNRDKFLIDRITSLTPYFNRHANYVECPTPTRQPTANPTIKPTKKPTNKPTTRSPTVKPTRKPSRYPSKRPSLAPTTSKPTKNPTQKPTKRPTNKPTTRSPTAKPTRKPSRYPSKRPTLAPTTSKPTKYPTLKPTKAPTNKPTKKPSKLPTSKPTRRPRARL